METHRNLGQVVRIAQLSGDVDSELSLHSV